MADKDWLPSDVKPSKKTISSKSTDNNNWLPKGYSQNSLADDELTRSDIYDLVDFVGIGKKRGRRRYYDYVEEDGTAGKPETETKLTKTSDENGVQRWSRTAVPGDESEPSPSEMVKVSDENGTQRWISSAELGNEAARNASLISSQWSETPQFESVYDESQAEKAAEAISDEQREQAAQAQATRNPKIIDWLPHDGDDLNAFASRTFNKAKEEVVDWVKGEWDEEQRYAKLGVTGNLRYLGHRIKEAVAGVFTALQVPSEAIESMAYFDTAATGAFLRMGAQWTDEQLAPAMKALYDVAQCDSVDYDKEVDEGRGVVTDWVRGALNGATVKGTYFETTPAMGGSFNPIVSRLFGITEPLRLAKVVFGPAKRQTSSAGKSVLANAFEEDWNIDYGWVLRHAVASDIGYTLLTNPAKEREFMTAVKGMYANDMGWGQVVDKFSNTPTEIIGTSILDPLNFIKIPIIDDVASFLITAGGKYGGRILNKLPITRKLVAESAQSKVRVGIARFRDAISEVASNTITTPGADGMPLESISSNIVKAMLGDEQVWSRASRRDKITIVQAMNDIFTRIATDSNDELSIAIKKALKASNVDLTEFEKSVKELVNDYSNAEKVKSTLAARGKQISDIPQLAKDGKLNETVGEELASFIGKYGTPEKAVESIIQATPLFSITDKGTAAASVVLQKYLYRLLGTSGEEKIREALISPALKKLGKDASKLFDLEKTDPVTFTKEYAAALSYTYGQVLRRINGLDTVQSPIGKTYRNMQALLKSAYLTSGSWLLGNLMDNTTKSFIIFGALPQFWKRDKFMRWADALGTSMPDSVMRGLVMSLLDENTVNVWQKMPWPLGNIQSARWIEKVAKKLGFSDALRNSAAYKAFILSELPDNPGSEYKLLSGLGKAFNSLSIGNIVSKVQEVGDYLEMLGRASIYVNRFENLYPGFRKAWELETARIMAEAGLRQEIIDELASRFQQSRMNPSEIDKIIIDLMRDPNRNFLHFFSENGIDLNVLGWSGVDEFADSLKQVALSMATPDEAASAVTRAFLGERNRLRALFSQADSVLLGNVIDDAGRVVPIVNLLSFPYSDLTLDNQMARFGKSLGDKGPNVLGNKYEDTLRGSRFADFVDNSDGTRVYGGSIKGIWQTARGTVGVDDPVVDLLEDTLAKSSGNRLLGRTTEGTILVDDYGRVWQRNGNYLENIVTDGETALERVALNTDAATELASRSRIAGKAGWNTKDPLERAMSIVDTDDTFGAWLKAGNSGSKSDFLLNIQNLINDDYNNRLGIVTMDYLKQHYGALGIFPNERFLNDFCYSLAVYMNKVDDTSATKAVWELTAEEVQRRMLTAEQWSKAIREGIEKGEVVPHRGNWAEIIKHGFKQELNAAVRDMVKPWQLDDLYFSILWSNRYTEFAPKMKALGIDVEDFEPGPEAGRSARFGRYLYEQYKTLRVRHYDDPLLYGGNASSKWVTPTSKELQAAGDAYTVDSIVRAFDSNNIDIRPEDINALFVGNPLVMVNRMAKPGDMAGNTLLYQRILELMDKSGNFRESPDIALRLSEVIKQGLDTISQRYIRGRAPFLEKELAEITATTDVAMRDELYRRLTKIGDVLMNAQDKNVGASMLMAYMDWYKLSDTLDNLAAIEAGNYMEYSKLAEAIKDMAENNEADRIQKLSLFSRTVGDPLRSGSDSIFWSNGAETKPGNITELLASTVTSYELRNTAYLDYLRLVKNGVGEARSSGRRFAQLEAAFKNAGMENASAVDVQKYFQQRVLDQANGNEQLLVAIRDWKPSGALIGVDETTFNIGREYELAREYISRRDVYNSASKWVDEQLVNFNSGAGTVISDAMVFFGAVDQIAMQMEGYTGAALLRSADSKIFTLNGENVSYQELFINAHESNKRIIEKVLDRKSPLLGASLKATVANKYGKIFEKNKAIQPRDVMLLLQGNFKSYPKNKAGNSTIKVLTDWLSSLDDKLYPEAKNIIDLISGEPLLDQVRGLPDDVIRAIVGTEDITKARQVFELMALRDYYQSIASASQALESAVSLFFSKQQSVDSAARLAETQLRLFCNDADNIAGGDTFRSMFRNISNTQDANTLRQEIRQLWSDYVSGARVYYGIEGNGISEIDRGDSEVTRWYIWNDNGTLLPNERYLSEQLWQDAGLYELANGNSMINIAGALLRHEMIAPDWLFIQRAVKSLDEVSSGSNKLVLNIGHEGDMLDYLSRRQLATIKDTLASYGLIGGLRANLTEGVDSIGNVTRIYNEPFSFDSYFDSGDVVQNIDVKLHGINDTPVGSGRYFDGTKNIYLTADRVTYENGQVKFNGNVIDSGVPVAVDSVVKDNETFMYVIINENNISVAGIGLANTVNGLPQSIKVYSSVKDAMMGGDIPQGYKLYSFRTSKLVPSKKNPAPLVTKINGENAYNYYGDVLLQKELTVNDVQKAMMPGRVTGKAGKAGTTDVILPRFGKAPNSMPNGERVSNIESLDMSDTSLAAMVDWHNKAVDGYSAMGPSWFENVANGDATLIPANGNALSVSDFLCGNGKGLRMPYGLTVGDVYAKTVYDSLLAAAQKDPGNAKIYADAASGFANWWNQVIRNNDNERAMLAGVLKDIRGGSERTDAVDKALKALGVPKKTIVGSTPSELWRAALNSVRKKVGLSALPKNYVAENASWDFTELFYKTKEVVFTEKAKREADAIAKQFVYLNYLANTLNISSGDIAGEIASPTKLMKYSAFLDEFNDAKPQLIDMLPGIKINNADDFYGGWAEGMLKDAGIVVSGSHSDTVRLVASNPEYQAIIFNQLGPDKIPGLWLPTIDMRDEINAWDILNTINALAYSQADADYTAAVYALGQIGERPYRPDIVSALKSQREKIPNLDALITAIEKSDMSSNADNMLYQALFDGVGEQYLGSEQARRVANNAMHAIFGDAQSKYGLSYLVPSASTDDKLRFTFVRNSKQRPFEETAANTVTSTTANIAQPDPWDLSMALSKTDADKVPALQMLNELPVDTKAKLMDLYRGYTDASKALFSSKNKKDTLAAERKIVEEVSKLLPDGNGKEMLNAIKNAQDAFAYAGLGNYLYNPADVASGIDRALDSSVLSHMSAKARATVQIFESTPLSSRSTICDAYRQYKSESKLARKTILDNLNVHLRTNNITQAQASDFIEALDEYNKYSKLETHAWSGGMSFEQLLQHNLQNIRTMQQHAPWQQNKYMRDMLQARWQTINQVLMGWNNWSGSYVYREPKFNADMFSFLSRQGGLSMLDKIKQSYADGLSDVRSKAVADVNYALFDYQGTRSNFMETMGHVFPFTIWQLNNIMLYPRLMLQKPGLLAYNAKVQRETDRELRRDVRSSRAKNTMALFKLDKPLGPIPAGEYRVDPRAVLSIYSQMKDEREWPGEENLTGWRKWVNQGFKSLDRIGLTPYFWFRWPFELARCFPGQTPFDMIPFTRYVKWAGLDPEGEMLIGSIVPFIGTDSGVGSMTIRQARMGGDDNFIEEYYTRLMLDEMTTKGEITYQQARDAKIAGSGELWDKAKDAYIRSSGGIAIMRALEPFNMKYYSNEQIKLLEARDAYFAAPAGSLERATIREAYPGLLGYFQTTNWDNMTDAEWSVKSAWEDYRTASDAIYTKYQAMIDNQIKQNPGSDFSALYDAREKELEAIRPTIPEPVNSTYKFQESDESRRTRRLSKLYALKPSTKDFTSDGKIDYESYNERLNEYYNTLPQLAMNIPEYQEEALWQSYRTGLEPKLALARIVMEEANQKAMYDYQHRYDSAYQALWNVYNETIYKPAYAKYNQLKINGIDGAWYKTIDAVGPVSGADLIDAVKAMYGERFTDEELRQAASHVYFPKLSDVTTERKEGEDKEKAAMRNMFMELYNSIRPACKEDNALLDSPVIEMCISSDTSDLATTAQYERAIETILQASEEDNSFFMSPDEVRTQLQLRWKLAEDADAMWPGIESVLSQYDRIGMPDNRKKFLGQHPELVSYFQWRKKWWKQHDATSASLFETPWLTASRAIGLGSDAE